MNTIRTPGALDKVDYMVVQTLLCIQQGSWDHFSLDCAFGEVLLYIIS